MPILTRQPEATDTAATHLASVQRPGGVAIGTPAASPGDLLLAGDSLALAPAPTPARALALDAPRLLRRLGDPDRRPGRWSQPTFRREIELVRAHLAPLRTRKALAASYGREAFHLSINAATRDDPGAVRLAYALRWLELGAGDIRSTWPPTELQEPA